MTKMTLQQKRELFVEMCKVREELNTNEELNKDILRKHLSFLPGKKLYKFRECTEQNFDTLEENCIWMSRAIDFQDPFDNTINIDPKANAEEIEKWLSENYPVFCFDMAEKLYEDLGFGESPFTHKDFVDYVKICLNEDGKTIEEKECEFLIAHASKDEIEQVKNVFQDLKILREKFLEIEESTFRHMSDVINLARTEQRDKSLIYCMTERYDNRALWENYAAYYTGFCIEYSFENIDELPFEDYKNLVYMFPMSYGDVIPYFNMVPMLDASFRHFIYKDDSWMQDPELEADLNMQLFYKNTDYSYEQEWRFSIKAENNNKQRFPFVNAIYAGKDITKDNLDRLREISDTLHVPLYLQTVNYSVNGFEYILIKEVSNE